MCFTANFDRYGRKWNEQILVDLVTENGTRFFGINASNLEIVEPEQNMPSEDEISACAEIVRDNPARFYLSLSYRHQNFWIVA